MKSLPAPPRFSAPLLCLLLSIAAASLFAQVAIEAEGDTYKVTIDDQPFTTYHPAAEGITKPILYPIYGPGGVAMTRDFPMKKGTKSEASDHPHHTSLFYTHGNVNGVNFWHVGGKNQGYIKQTHATTSSPDSTADGAAVLATKLNWQDQDGKLVMKEDRVWRFSKTERGARAIEIELTFHASEGDVTFHDDKEGCMGIRTHPALRLRGDVATGKAVNSAGGSGKGIWGKKAAWVNYTGTVDGKDVGIAIMDHPDNPRHPTTWHARDYGLVAANPFGLSHFEKAGKGAGDFTIKKGDKVTWKYRFEFHPQIDVANAFNSWSTAKVGTSKTGPTDAAKKQTELKKLKGLMVAGGCCHDYEKQPEILAKGINERAAAFGVAIEWTIVRDKKDRATKHKAYTSEDWAKEYDIVLHNECYGGVKDDAFIENITKAHKEGGLPSVSVHCSTHSYRDSKTDEWRKLIGATSRKHGPHKPVTVIPKKLDHPIMRDFPEQGWTTGKEELYYILEMWPGATILAEGKQGDQTHPIAWVKKYGKARSFNTTLGHYNETMSNPIYLDLISNGVEWALGDEEK